MLLKKRDNVIWLIAGATFAAGLLTGWATVFFGYNCGGF